MPSGMKTPMAGKTASPKVGQRKSWKSWYSRLTLVLPVAYMAGIFYLSSKKGSGLSLPAPDYIMHALLYAGLGVCWRLALSTGLGLPRRRAIFLVLVVATIYGVTDEWHQSFVPGRSPELSDLVADSAGAVVSQVCWEVAALLRRMMRRFRER